MWDGEGGLIRGDQNRVRQIFANLLTNGIKYGPPGTAVTVTGVLSETEISVAVEDRGRGIAEGDLPYVFDEFFQVPGRSEPGIGLGLAVAHDLAEAHGGTIDVRSTLGRGTCFTARLTSVAGVRGLSVRPSDRTAPGRTRPRPVSDRGGAWQPPARNRRALRRRASGRGRQPRVGGRVSSPVWSPQPRSAAPSGL